MKKWISIAAAFLLGVVVTLTAGDAFAKAKSLIGQKVTGEYTVYVNNKELPNKGAVIDGVTNAPVRAISDSIGGNLSIDNKKKVINITVNSIESQTPGATTSEGNSGNKYLGSSKSSLEELKNSIDKNRIKPAMEGKEYLEKQIEELKKGGDSGTSIGVKEKELKEIEDILSKANEELRLVEEALQALEK